MRNTTNLREFIDANIRPLLPRSSNFLQTALFDEPAHYRGDESNITFEHPFYRDPYTRKFKMSCLQQDNGKIEVEICLLQLEPDSSFMSRGVKRIWSTVNCISMTYETTAELFQCSDDIKVKANALQNFWATHCTAYEAVLSLERSDPAPHA